MKRAASDNTKDKAAKPKKRGRQSEFNQRTADRICELVIEGKSLRRICARKDMPQKRTVLRWLDENEEFARQYAWATDARGDTYADYITDLVEKANENNYNSTRVKIEALKWIASKLKPKKYGDRLGVDLQADVTVREKHPWGNKPREQWSDMDAIEFRKHYFFMAAVGLKEIRDSLGQAAANECLISLAHGFGSVEGPTKLPALPAPPPAPSTRAREDDGDVIDGDVVVI